MNIIKKIKEKLADIQDERKKTTIARAIKFSKENRNCLIVMLDQRNDDIVVAYQDIYIAAQVKSKYLGLKTGLVKHLILGHDDEKELAKDMNTLNYAIAEFLYQLPKIIKNKKVAQINNELTKNLNNICHAKL